MTRSMEIPDEGRLRGLYDDTRTLSIRGSINHEVAIKLGDEEAFFTWAEDLLAVATQAAIEADSLPSAPAGDGGLREALERLVRLKDGPRDEEYHATRDAAWQSARDALAHPAAPAVPQPVDREALVDLLSDFVDSDDCWYDHHGYCQAHGWFRTEPACPHARAKAVLAGEQEQDS